MGQGESKAFLRLQERRKLIQNKSTQQAAIITVLFSDDPRPAGQYENVCEVRRRKVISIAFRVHVKLKNSQNIADKTLGHKNWKYAGEGEGFTSLSQSFRNTARISFAKNRPKFDFEKFHNCFLNFDIMELLILINTFCA